MLFFFYKYVPVIPILIFSTQLWAQDFSNIKQQGEDLFANKNYEAALNSFSLLEEKGQADSDVLTKIGACHFELGNLGMSEEKLNAAVGGNSPNAETWRYLAKIYHERFQFEEAIKYYKSFLRTADADHPFRPAVKDDLIRCGNGIHVRRQKNETAVVNLGQPINSAEDEFTPLLHPRKRNHIFFAKTSSDEGIDKGSDIFFSKLDDGDWGQPKPLSIFLNSVENEVPMGFDEAGERIYFFRGKTPFSGDIFWDTLRENTLNGTLFIQNFEGPVRAWEGDRDLFFFTDSILLFSSRREGGYGGFDLYVATLQPDGWSAAENLGPVINSAYDEVSPFLATDGRTLYFSTNDVRRSIGGTDIMRSFFLDRTRKWIPAENLGIGLNSAGNDEHFSLSQDGSRAFFSSSRKEGYGQRDLYVGIFGETKKEQLHRSEPVAFLHVLPESEEEKKTVSIPAETGENNTFILSPLRYPMPNMPLTEASFRKLDELIGWMKKVPELKVTFVAHTALADHFEVGQSALQQVEETLSQSGVSTENTAFRNAGSVFTLSDGNDSDNRRIDLILSNPEVLPIKVESQTLENSRASFFQRAMGGLVFQVKIPLDESVSREQLFQDYPDGNILESPLSEKATFVRGIYLTWNSALQAQNEMNQNGYPQARATPYLRGWELSETEAENLLESFPDLEGFLRQ